jgi:F0F1-type ATP synthase assembly protein I
MEPREPSQPSTDSVDPAIDPEIARLAGRVAPSRSALAPLRIMGLGWVIVLTLVLGVLGGIWIDGAMGTSPLATIVGTGLGLLGAYLAARSLVRESRRM